MRKILQERFGDQIHVISKKDEGVTGNFEITIDGKLVHSKQKGDGFVDTEAKKSKLCEAIFELTPAVEKPDVPLLSSIQVEPKDEPTVTEAEKKASRRSLCVSIFTLLISIPALIGAWCWPALVIAAISGSVSAAARSLGHAISFGVTALMMVIVNAFMLYTMKNRDRSRGLWFFYGPLALTMLATPLILADLVRHVLQDAGVWPECDRPADVIWNSDCDYSSSQYHCNLIPPHCVPNSQENMFHLAPMGVLFTICFTYMGFACLMVGTLWNANICEKLKDLREQWAEIRSNM